MTTIGNIGIGLFILILLWLITFCVFIYSVRIQSNIGWIVLIAATVITITLVVIPTKPKDKQEDINSLEKDYASLYRQLLLFFLFSSALLACVIFFFAHCIEPLKGNLVKTF